MLLRDALIIWIVIALHIFNTDKALGYDLSTPDTTFSHIGVSFTIPSEFFFRDNSWVKDRIEFKFDCRINNVAPSILPGFYLMNQDSSVLILVEDYKIYKGARDPFSIYSIDPNGSILYDISRYADTVHGTPRFAKVNELNKSNADRMTQFAFKCSLVNSEYTQVVVRQFLKFNQGFVKVYYLAKSHVTDLDQIIKRSDDFIHFGDSFKTNNVVDRVGDYYVAIDDQMMENRVQSLFNKGGIYHGLWYFTGEKYAFEKDSVVISLQFPSNKMWPYFNFVSFKEQSSINPDKWDAANEDYKKYLVNSTDQYEVVSKKLLQKLNADEGYLFDFSHDSDDLYRDEYRDCKVLIVHKKNIGSFILKFYYKPTGKKKINKFIKKTWGQIAFKDLTYFSQFKENIFPY